MAHKKEHVTVHDQQGNVIGGFPFTALIPLLSAAVGPLLNKIMGNGAKHIKIGNHVHKLHKVHGKGFSDAESYLVPHVYSNHLGGAMGFGAAHGLPINLGIKGSLGGKKVGGASHWQGYSEDIPVQYAETSTPIGGAMGFGATGFGGAIGFGRKKTTKKTHKKKGGYAVDQLHSNAYTGFTPGPYKAMFPVNMAGINLQ